MFVMYCVNGASRSSLLIESTDYDKHEIEHGIGIQEYIRL